MTTKCTPQSGMFGWQNLIYLSKVEFLTELYTVLRKPRNIFIKYICWIFYTRHLKRIFNQIMVTSQYLHFSGNANIYKVYIMQSFYYSIYFIQYMRELLSGFYHPACRIWWIGLYNLVIYIKVKKSKTVISRLKYLGIKFILCAVHRKKNDFEFWFSYLSSHRTCLQTIHS